MKSGSDRKVILALLAIAALCVIGLGASLYRHKVAHLSRLEKELTEKKQKLAEAKEKVAAKDDLEARFSELQDQLAVLEPSLPDAAYIPTFLRQIENLAAKTNNQILMIRPKEQEKKKPGKAVKINNETGEVIKEDSSKNKKAGSGKGDQAEEEPKLPYDKSDIELKIKGTYWSVVSFLDELQKFPKLISVNDLAFSPERGGGSDQGPNAEIDATLSLTAVIMKGGKG